MDNQPQPTGTDQMIQQMADAQGILLEAMVGQVKENPGKYFDHVLDFDNLPKQQHIWVDRGVFMSCEGAAHAHHQVAKRRK
jgi:hypothetical protein